MHRIENRAGRTGAGLAAVLFLIAAALPVEAQYFGRNKVQYDDFDWQVMETPSFDIHFYPEERTITGDAARMSERWRARLSLLFEHELSERKPIVFYANHADFQQTNITPGLISVGTGGITEPLRTRMFMPFTGVYKEDNRVLGHELVHVYQFDIAGSPEAGGIGAMGRLPLWFIEGMAEYLALGRVDPLTAMWMRDAVMRDDLPTIDDLTNTSEYFPYRYGQALLAYIGGRWGDPAVARMYRIALREGLDAAYEQVLNMTDEQLTEAWHAATRELYQPMVRGRTRPDQVGRLVLGETERGDMNLGPVVSPDGRFVAFFSREDLFTIDLNLADATSGEIVEELASPLDDPHFDAISFINSAGTWSPDGRNFAFVVFGGGTNKLAILDVATQDVLRRIEIAGVGDITSPAWSPDGTRIAFSGSLGGISNLFVYDMRTERVEQLTDDRYGDLHPEWSPDGSSIAWSTDRGPATNLQALEFGPMRIAVMEVATRRVQLLPGFANAKHINPQYSPDGRSLYFISDASGFNDIYRQDLGTGQIYRVTNIATGVSGISHLSPAMSVARRTGRLMFSVFWNDGYNVFALEQDGAQGVPVQQPVEPGIAAAAVLPPVRAVDRTIVSEYLDDPRFGLPPATVEYPVEEYSASLGVEYIGQPTFGVGTGTFGTTVGGGVSIYFSDLLNNQTVGAVVEATGEIQDIGGQLFYQNAKNRLNWMVGAARVPYVSGFAGTRDVRPGEDAPPDADIVLEQVLQRTFVHEAVAAASYPLSLTRRLELSGGYSRYSYDYEVQQFYAIGNRIIAERERELNAPDPLDLYRVSAAFVGDYSYFGFTSPVAGGRYRFEATPTFGTLSFTSVLADYRRYLFANPFSFAFRALHYGRYGGSAGDSIMSPLYVGSATLVRGYTPESFSIDECTNGAVDGCPEFNRLIGTRMAVANFELRIPLLGTPDYGIIPLSFLPVEVAPFIDAGLAWGEVEGRPGTANDPELRFDRNTPDRVPVFSAGVTTRINLFGYLIGEIWYAYPFQRPEKGGHFGFAIAPGW